MIHVYYGDGQGKTSAATGLALRALGAGWSVQVVQFLKDGSSHEMQMLQGLPGARVVHDGDLAMFTYQMDDDVRRAVRELHNAHLRAGLDEARAGRVGMLVLDEVLDALQAGLLDEALLREALELGGTDGKLAVRAAAAQPCAAAGVAAGAASAVELVITGHTLPVFVYDAADYVTYMQAREHPYRRGVAARPGVEW